MEMDIEVIYSFDRPKKEPKQKGRKFVGVKIRDRWGNVYNLYPFYAKSWEEVCKDIARAGYEAISYDSVTAP